MSREGDRQTLAQAFKCAGEGVAATAHGRNFRIQAAFALAAIALGAACQALSGPLGDQMALGRAEWLTILVCIGAVLSGECANTALEAAVDLASPGYHELAKRAKDCAAGSVLVSSAVSLVIGIIIFVPRLPLLLGA